MLSPDRVALAAPSSDLPLELVVDLAGVGLCVVGPGGRIVSANREWLHIAGARLEDAVGRSILEVFPDPALGADLEAALRTGEVEILRRPLAGDEEAWWEGKIASLPLRGGTGLLVTARDATIDAAQEYAAEQAVRGQSRLAHTLIEAVPAGIALLEPPHFRVRWANAAAQQLLDEAFRTGSIAGRTVAELVPGAEASGLLRHLRRVAATGMPFEVPEFPFDGFARGRTFWRWSAHPLPRDGRPDDVMVVAVEVSDRARARERAERATARARAAAGWLEALQDVTGALGSARTPREVATVLATRGVKAVGARALAIGRLQGPEVVFDLHGGYLADALAPGGRLPLDGGAHEALLRDRRPLWFGSAEEIDVAFPGERSLRERLGIRAWAGFPLLVGDRAIGALSFAFDAPQEFEEAERSFHLALAQQCTQALDRAFVFERERALQARLAFGSDLTAALASARTADDVVRTVLDRGIPAFGAHAGFVVVPMGAPERTVRILGRRGPGAEEVAAWEGVSVEHPAAARALELGAPVWLGSREDAQRRFPSLPATDGGSAAWAAIPLTAEGRRLGVLALSFAGEQGFDLSDRAAILSLAGACAQAMDRVRLDEAERTARREAEEARSEAERVGRLQEQLFAVVGHDLRTPLCAVVAGVHVLLQREDLPYPAVRTLGRVRSSAQRMTDMIRDLLDFSRARQGLLISVERAPVDLGAVVRRVLQEFQATQPDRIRVEVRGEILVLGDGSRLAQVIANLVGNALQHGEPGGPVEVRATGAQPGAMLEVHNRGTVPAAILPNVFEPFRQADDGAGGGIGLGLYISREIVRAHGGEIAIRSTAAEGTTVTVRLPLVKW